MCRDDRLLVEEACAGVSVALLRSNRATACVADLMPALFRQQTTIEEALMVRLPRAPIGRPQGRYLMLYRSSICAAALATALLATPSAAQVVDFGKYPDFKGQWVRTGNPNNWRELAGPPPLTPEYQKVFEEITADLKSGGPGNWPSTFCTPAGMPAMMSFYDPGEIIVPP